MAEAEIRDIEAEHQWELRGVDDGVKRYREAVAKANDRAQAGGRGGLADMEAGEVMLTEILKPLIPAVREAQDEAFQTIQGRGKIPKWAVPMLCLEAEKLAVVIVRSTLAGLSVEIQDYRPVTPLSIAIAGNAKTQREFDLFKQKEAEKKKAAEDSGDAAVDLYKLMERRVKKVDARNAKKWMKLSEESVALDWDKETKVHFGHKCVQLLVEHGGGWFEMQMHYKGNGRQLVTERQIKLTDVAKEYITHYHAVSELQRPFMLPMIAKPNDWKKEMT
ncbi:hypothetical protein KAJ83_01700 [Marivibrio halodurans]|uniref:DNA-directed RNA polymerase N-terminal domain-containing protein n=1 Tax=Marivibrio halodurans TaxID=2039722 RepID=A0A8J7RVZ8_9PROT|nr:hypothetical protein [Marivibrio halodurans]MBP5855707.1 hypothetical protein [Marivibrio halodurans]